LVSATSFQVGGIQLINRIGDLANDGKTNDSFKT